jgi:hypothetical protein
MKRRFDLESLDYSVYLIGGVQVVAKIPQLAFFYHGRGKVAVINILLRKIETHLLDIIVTSG